MRDKAIIPWTADVDLSVFSLDVMKNLYNNTKLRQRFNDMGVHFFKDSAANMMRGCFADFYQGGKLMCWNFNQEVVKNSYTHLDNIPYLDVYSMTKKPQGTVSHYSCIFNETMIFPLGEAKVLDLILPAPGKLHEFVSWAYGPNYTTPPPKKIQPWGFRRKAL